MSTPLAINLTDVAKIYKGKVHALQGVAMQVHQGEIFGLLGPNGAGKSTLVKIITTVVKPTRAGGTVLDNPIGHKPTLARLGYLPENHRFPRYLTGRQTIEFFGAMAGMPRPARKKRAGELLETVGMTAWADRKVGTYSKGMMQRVGIGQALINDPDLVLLDEPTDGVDPLGRRDIREVLNRMKSEGRTTFINSHLLSELELVCDRVAILVKGLVVKQGTIDELTMTQQRYEIEVVASDPSAAAASVQGALPGLNWSASEKGAIDTLLPGRMRARFSGMTLQLSTADPAAVQPILDTFRRAGLVIRRVQSVRPSLEDLFIETLGGANASHAAGASLQEYRP
jgi:ABC-2 type transport system ATP-binding protein